MNTKAIDIRENHIELADLLAMVKEGVEVILTDGTTPVARLMPLSEPPAPRAAGLHAHLGPTWTSADFDGPLPDEFWLGADYRKAE